MVIEMKTLYEWIDINVEKMNADDIAITIVDEDTSVTVNAFLSREQAIAFAYTILGEVHKEFEQ